MQYAELQTYLDSNWKKTSLTRPVTEYPFDRLRALLAHFRSPEREGERVGVTGSKGKGSIARILTEVLLAHGMRVGLFTSPHLVAVEERVQLDGRPLPPAEFARRFGLALERQRAAGLEDLGVTPLLLALGLEYFREHGAQVAVLEVRAGGRFDPIKVAEPPIVCLGPIGLEHVPGLGYTLAEIAWQKAGLIQPGGICLSSPQPIEAQRVLEQECSSLGARLLQVNRDLDYTIRQRSERGQIVDLRLPGGSYQGLPLSLIGEHQATNTAVAVGAAEVLLSGQGRRLEPDALAAALARVRWPGRLEWLRRTPPLLYDGAHTPESAAALAQALADHFPRRRWTLLLGILSGKDAAGILTALAPVAASILCLPVPGFRHQPPGDLCRIARSLGLDAAEHPSLPSALADADARGNSVCITGTLYLYAEALEALGR